jgi:hypothetical protein
VVAFRYVRQNRRGRNVRAATEPGEESHETADDAVLGMCCNVEMAVSKTTSPPQAVSAAYQQAMEEGRYRMPARLRRAHVRWVYIESCFKQLTGMYPFQVNAKCSYHVRSRDAWC